MEETAGYSNLFPYEEAYYDPGNFIQSSKDERLNGRYKFLLNNNGYFIERPLFQPFIFFQPLRDSWSSLMRATRTIWTTLTVTFTSMTRLDIATATATMTIKSCFPVKGILNNSFPECPASSTVAMPLLETSTSETTSQSSSLFSWSPIPTTPDPPRPSDDPSTDTTTDQTTPFDETTTDQTMTTDTTTTDTTTDQTTPFDETTTDQTMTTDATTTDQSTTELTTNDATITSDEIQVDQTTLKISLDCL